MITFIMFQTGMMFGCSRPLVPAFPQVSTQHRHLHHQHYDHLAFPQVSGITVNHIIIINVNVIIPSLKSMILLINKKTHR